MIYKILVDENIPFAAEAFSQFGQVELIPGRDIVNDSLNSVDILIVRSITRVDEGLLKGSSVRFVGTTTIGEDHIDKEYLKRNNIGFANAPGCNADSVAEYVFAGLFKIAAAKGFNLQDKSIGIIGNGNTGSRAARIADAAGMKKYINDPPLQRKTGDAFYVSYAKSLEADILTYHVPLNMDGIDKTYHMLSKSELNKFNESKIILNASRGKVISNDDLKDFLQDNHNTVILDVWENEPEIDVDLLNLVYKGTPHIAGYSYEGKVNGTIMIFKSLARFLRIDKEWKPDLTGIDKNVINYPEGKLEESIDMIISGIYDMNADDNKLRKVNDLEAGVKGRYFDQLRKNYPVRREFTNYTIRISKKLQKEIRILKALRFNIKEI